MIDHVLAKGIDLATASRKALSAVCFRASHCTLRARSVVTTLAYHSPGREHAG